MTDAVGPKGHLTALWVRMSRARAGRMLVMGAVFLAALTLWLLQGADRFAPVANGLSREAIEGWVAAAGILGPSIVIGMMIFAVVASPVPSAPIALAAGAAYGHGYGTVYVVIGAEIGALVAFGLGRWLGRDVLLKWFGARFGIGMLGSQDALTAIVLFSRLMPFLSFDLVSYAAGLSALRTWRFALATLTGIIPASFLLAHVGGEVTSTGTARAAWAVLGLGLITGLPLLIAAFRDKGNNNNKYERETM